MQLAEQAKARFVSEPETEAPLWAHWNKIVDAIEKHALARRPKMRVFEVHHMNETARAALLTAFVARKPDTDLEIIALQSIGLGGES